MENNLITEHKAGFVNIIGKPNVGKSTLMNSLVGERLSIITSKAQTTRHRILGIVNGEDFQIVYSDTPGIIRPAYKMQEAMMRFVADSLEDADILLIMSDVNEDTEAMQEIAARTNPLLISKKIFLLNKADLIAPEAVDALLEKWKQLLRADEYLSISALKGDNLGSLFDKILAALPYSPPYYPDKDALTDRPERFFMSEIIREKILLNYKQEIPYSVEIMIESFKEEEDIVRISAIIFCNRTSQKPILIGKAGKSLKKVGTQARIDMEKFLQKKVFLELYVKVKEGWRDSNILLKNMGYE